MLQNKIWSIIIKSMVKSTPEQWLAARWEWTEVWAGEEEAGSGQFFRARAPIFLDTLDNPVWSQDQPWQLSSATSRLKWWCIMGAPLGEAQNTSNHKSGHLDKEWPLPLVGYKNSKLQPPIAGAWLYHRSCLETCWASILLDGGHHFSCELGTNTCLSICGCRQWLGLGTSCSLWSLLSNKLPIISGCNPCWRGVP